MASVLYILEWHIKLFELEDLQNPYTRALFDC